MTRPRFATFFVALSVFFVLAGCRTVGGPAARATATPKPTPRAATVSLPVETFALPNGLTVALHEDHTAPIVAVNVWYHVGSRDEEPGRTGLAHLFEHVMFQGSLHHNQDHFVTIQSLGGVANGSTASDFTKYFEVVPSNALELALWLEADRMANLLPTLSAERFENQRQVVKNEKRERYDNPPLGDVGTRTGQLLYPAGHPYHNAVIGSMADLDSASLDDVRAFSRRHYVPNNAALSITGDFDPVATRRMIARFFGAIPAGPRTARVAPPQPARGALRASMEDRVPAPRLFMTWTAPAQFTADEPAVDLMTLVLGDGRTSRLISALVHERKLARSIDLGFNTRELVSEVRLNATPAEGVTLAQLEAAVDEEIAKLRDAAPTDAEMQRAFNIRESSFVAALQSTQERGDLLGYYTLFQGRGDFIERDLARYRAVTAADVQRVAREYLGANRVVFTVAPGAAKTPLPDLATGDAATSATRDAKSAAHSSLPPEIDLGAQPVPGAAPALRLPAVRRARLANGLDVFIVARHKLPTVNLHLLIKSGAADNPDGRSGVAALTAAMMEKGTSARSATELASDLGSVGARIVATADFDSTAISLETLARHLDAILPLFVGVVVEPALPPDELQVELQARQVALAQSRQNARSLATLLMPELLYGTSHPYGRPVGGTEESLQAIARADLAAFHADRYRPDNAALIVVGDVDERTIVAQLDRAFSNWRPKPVAPRLLPPAAPRTPGLYAVDRAGSAQASIQIGTIGVPRTSAEYFPLLVMNAALGGSFGSRLNQKLRESSGISYNPRSTFSFRRGAGPFVAAADVQSSAAARGVGEMLGEIDALRSSRPLSDAELEAAKRFLALAVPRTFDTPQQVARQLATIALFDLPIDYFDSYVARILAVTRDDVQRVAARALDPARLSVIVVGDVKSAEAGLRALPGIGHTFTLLDVRGRPASDPNAR